MVEIRYGDQYEVTDLAGCTVGEVREQFRDELNIPDRATVKLNGAKVKANAEHETVLNDDDKLSFAVSRGKGAYLIGALLLALAVTGGVFAFGFVNASTSLTNPTVSNTNFADVSANSTGLAAIDWDGYGFFAGSVTSSFPNHSTNSTPIFNVDTETSGYTGDLVVTVSLGNADELADVYRMLALRLEMRNTDGSIMDINEDGSADGNDWVMLTLNNGSVSMFPGGTDNMTTVRVKSGFFITHVRPFSGFPAGNEDPDFFAEVAQR